MTRSDFTKTLQSAPPVDCGFSLGDTVTFTNEYGVSFSGRQIIGFAETTDFYGRFIYLDNSAYWFPCKPSELNIQ